jgi:PPP family 3-phenylpropionic acid transporter
MRQAPLRLADGAVRTGAFYVALFGGTGVSLPYIALWFRAHGLSGAEIGVVLAAPMLARLVTGPLVAVWADSWRLRRTPLFLLALVAAAGYGLIGFTDGIWAWLPLWFVAATATGNLIPLIDVLTLRRARREGFSFGVPRGTGSLAFIGANVAMGAMLAQVKTDAILVWTVGAALAAALAGAFVLPDEPVSETGRLDRGARFRGIGRLLGDPVFMTAIVSVGLIQATHAFYYGFSALLWKAQGIGEGLVGLLWAWGVVAEIVFLWFLEPWRQRLGPWGLLVAGGLGAAVRWAALAFSPPLWLLWPLQLLHGLSFAASYMGGLRLVERLSPPENVSAAQTLSSALSGGVLIGLATVFSGALFDRYGATGYLGMAALALVGLLGAWRLKKGLGAGA